MRWGGGGGSAVRNQHALFTWYEMFVQGITSFAQQIEDKE